MYKEAIVSFIDIIGFKSLIDTNKSAKEILTILNIFSTMSGVNNVVCGTQPAVFNFSDSVIRIRDVAAVNKNYIEQLFVTEIMILGNIQRRMIEKGILIRGGTTQGDIYFDDNHIFGQGFNEAYCLEKKAQYPRIVISKKLTEKYKNYRNFNILFKKDSKNDIWFIDYLNHVLFVDEEIKKQYNEEFLKNQKNAIEENYKRLSKDEKIELKNKYDWLSDYHNKRVKDLELDSDCSVNLN